VSSCRNRPTTTADFPALPPWADSSHLKVADRPWVLERLQTGETLAGLLCGIIKDVVAYVMAHSFKVSGRKKL